MKDESRNMGAGVVTLTEIIWAQTGSLSLESRTDRFWPRLSDGKKESSWLYTWAVVTLLLLCTPTVRSLEKAASHHWGKDIRNKEKILAFVGVI